MTLFSNHIAFIFELHANPKIFYWTALFPQVVEAIITLAPEFVRMPNTPEAMQDVAEEFEAMYGFPQLLGCIDGTLVKIQTPTQDEHIFVDRKGNHSINCQIICDSHMRILDVVARWPGSVHDGGIFEVSQMKHRFDNHVFGDYKLLGMCGFIILLIVSCALNTNFSFFVPVRFPGGATIQAKKCGP